MSRARVRDRQNFLKDLLWQGLAVREGFPRGGKPGKGAQAGEGAQAGRVAARARSGGGAAGCGDNERPSPQA